MKVFPTHVAQDFQAVDTHQCAVVTATLTRARPALSITSNRDKSVQIGGAPRVTYLRLKMYKMLASAKNSCKQRSTLTKLMQI